ncbi:MAG: RNA methyltransferase [Acidobacteriota bacterium]|jgi:tRNA (guanosine-2'-O-)-methyltransferase
MPNRWHRWRGYMDELEEVARICGEQVAEAERSIRQTYERDTWRRPQEEGVEPELVRRALDIPFLGDLIRAAWRVGSAPEAPDRPHRSWPSDREETARTSAGRGKGGAGDPPPPEEAPPARLRSAERALAGRTRSVAVVLEQVTNPRNVSAVMRTAEVLGLQEVHVIEPAGRPKLMRSVTKSCEKYLDLFWYRTPGAALDRLRGRGYRVLAADHAAGSVPLDEVPLGEKVAVVLGSEQLGVSAMLREAADGLFYIPTPGFASYLNVSAAASLALYEIDRRMRAAGLRAPLGPEDAAALRRSWYALLAGSDETLRRRYLGWVDRPPEPAPAFRPVASRERAAGRGPAPSPRPG